MDKISTIKENILQYIEKQSISKTDFYEKTGFSASNFKGKGLNSEIGGDKIVKILSLYKDINIEWLITGKGSMLKSDLNTPSDSSVNYGREEKNLIPLYDGVVTAGMQETAILDPTQQPAEMIDAGDWFRDATAAMRVHGDSMYPEYKSGSIAALREVKNKRLVVYGQDYLLETSEYRVIKRLQKSDLPQNWLACSVNEEKYESSGRLIHEPFDVHIDDVTRLYQVLGNVKRNQSSSVIHANKFN
ncbi:helix-turn-helix transcriptional regulator [Flavobacterium psychroterrae]|uniref:Helix-turn-helix transcriptional regulator n=1 Tax=Flavobacterium psychroterrae TaxID=2133767 RepID=A0ABS5PEW6_9FLAO|nr:S24 family peptidase [Flavobacterium psychroterrae]MBS7232842.1 helix-turn-helix transcriptional regulator [Flavobacterium psychroterrae]